MIAVLLATLLAGELDGRGVARLHLAHKGKPVLVSLWATWCAPCVEEFPALVALAQKRKDIVFLSVSIDDPESRGAVEEFVRTRKPPFPVYSRSPSRDEEFIDGVDPEWSGVVPTIIIYGRRGKREALLQGEFSIAEVEGALQAASR